MAEVAIGGCACTVLPGIGYHLFSWRSDGILLNDSGGRITVYRKRDKFTTTRWSVVLSAGQISAPDSEAALATLCRDYWYPLYAFLRRRGHTCHEAEDLTQAFFARMIEKRDFRLLDPARGKFRSSAQRKPA